MGSQSATRPRTLGLPKGIAGHFHFRKGPGGVNGGYCYVCCGGATHAVANFAFLQAVPRFAMRGRHLNAKKNLLIDRRKRQSPGLHPRIASQAIQLDEELAKLGLRTPGGV